MGYLKKYITFSDSPFVFAGNFMCANKGTNILASFIAKSCLKMFFLLTNSNRIEY